MLQRIRRYGVFVIAMKSRGHHGVLYHWQLNCIFNTSFRLTMNIPKVRITCALWGKSTVYPCVPSQVEASNVDRLPMSWRHTYAVRVPGCTGSGCILTSASQVRNCLQNYDRLHRSTRGVWNSSACNHARSRESPINSSVYYVCMYCLNLKTVQIGMFYMWIKPVSIISLVMFWYYLRLQERRAYRHWVVQRAHGATITSLWRYNDVVSTARHNYVINAPCVRWVVFGTAFTSFIHRIWWWNVACRSPGPPFTNRD